MKTNRATSFTRCYTWSVCIQSPLPGVLVRKSKHLIHLHLLWMWWLRSFPGRILIHFQAIPCPCIQPAMGRTWKYYSPPPELPEVRSGAMQNLSMSTRPAQYSVLLSCWIFSICLKLNTSLAACRRNNLHGINPLEITFVFSSQQNLTGPADSAGSWERGVLPQPWCRALAPIPRSRLHCHMFAVVRSECL